MSRQHKQEFHVVRLNGFIHTDDKLALKEIWRQLGKEMDAEDEVNARVSAFPSDAIEWKSNPNHLSQSNYADTMASLLALLSHPSEMAQAEAGVTSQAVVFVIDEFDMFATHPRQTLLYNLFDIAQARKAPIAVLGCTTRMDVVEMLEKRVKSRFSHRYVYLSLPKSLPAYWKVCKQGLSVDDEDMEVEGIDVSIAGHEAFHTNWKAMIDVGVPTILPVFTEASRLPVHRTSTRINHYRIFCNIITQHQSPCRHSCQNAYFPCHVYHQVL